MREEGEERGGGFLWGRERRERRWACGCGKRRGNRDEDGGKGIEKGEMYVEEGEERNKSGGEREQRGKRGI